MSKTFTELEQLLDEALIRIEALENSQANSTRLKCLELACKSNDENPIKRATDYIKFVNNETN